TCRRIHVESRGYRGMEKVSDNYASTPRIGVIGLGAMGMGTATALLARGLAVTGCDLSVAARRVFENEGGRCVDTPAALATHCNIVLLVVVNADQVEQVLFGEQGLAANLAPGSVVLQCATVAPRIARRIGERLEEAGLEMLDAPISGGAAK